MNRPLYAVCPRCGKRAKITGTARGRDEDEKIAQIKCTCGTAQISYTESQVLNIDLNNPYMQEDHYDLIIPPGWDRNMWNKISAVLPH